MPHDHPHAHHHPHGHNHGPGADHLHSHLGHADPAEDVQALAAQFIEGFVAATDKAAWLKLAGIPDRIEDPDGGPALRLVDVRLVSEWQVGTASPAFGSAELSYLPFPGGMISGRTNMSLLYVSLRTRREVDLRGLLRDRL